MKVLQALLDIRQLLSDPTKWTQGALARDATGKTVDSYDPTACQWCVYGATELITKGSERDEDWVISVMRAAARTLGLSDHLGLKVNDGPNGYVNVLRILDQAILDHNKGE
jgi:hypothetical protein